MRSVARLFATLRHRRQVTHHRIVSNEGSIPSPLPSAPLSNVSPRRGRRRLGTGSRHSGSIPRIAAGDKVLLVVRVDGAALHCSLEREDVVGRPVTSKAPGRHDHRPHREGALHGLPRAVVSALEPHPDLSGGVLGGEPERAGLQGSLTDDLQQPRGSTESTKADVASVNDDGTVEIRASRSRMSASPNRCGSDTRAVPPARRFVVGRRRGKRHVPRATSPRPPSPRFPGFPPGSTGSGPSSGTRSGTNRRRGHSGCRPARRSPWPPRLGRVRLAPWRTARSRCRSSRSDRARSSRCTGGGRRRRTSCRGCSDCRR